MPELASRTCVSEVNTVSNQIQIVRGIPELRETVRDWRRQGLSVALVPTMGALHAGHISLVRRAAELADRTIVSIFVNPTQFAPNEDLARYPRTEAADLALLGPERCDLVWTPQPADMYPEGFATRVLPAGAAAGLESDFRPHFFGGVATVCSKLFGATTPDIAIFGEKDYQQLCVIRQLVRDLNIPIEIVGAETAREPDDLALSSRNVYLSTEERTIAPALARVLRDTALKAQALLQNTAAARPAPKAVPMFPEPGQPAPIHQLPALERLCEAASEQLRQAGFAKVDYVAVREADTLRPVNALGARPLRVLGAAWLGTTRLIDNVPG
ncbi:pantoate--beta-alanine ligase [Hyphomicrobium sulfonivorans]|nr:pantoate--beta-alanine ligase [Hyphomicrobium sulfonivorans]NSL72956.1 pantoate--beta-alanine ligase [Hyphomicrobium sulfonivorans]